MSMEQEESTKRSLVTSLAVLLVIVVIVGGVVALTRGGSSSDNSQAGTNTTETTPTQETTDSQQPSSNQADGEYQDGSYTATGTYNSPGGRESITVNVTLDDGKVTNTSATGNPSDSTAHDFQNEFIKAYKSLVVGKDIDSIRLSQVSGSSLTSQGFNAALSQIKSQAQSDS